jgi:hypothetical protein
VKLLNTLKKYLKKIMERILENDELIAIFMGFKRDLGYTYKDGIFYQHADRMGVYGPTSQPFEYNTSWDWLLPVVEKIESLGFIFTIHSDAAYIRKFWYKGNFPHIGNVAENKITATYKTVVEFIKWYNEYKQ